MFDVGKYRGRITDYGVIGPGPGGEHQQVFVEFEIVGRYDPATGQAAACSSGRRTYYKAITPKTIDWLFLDLKAIGYDRDSFQGLDPEAPGAVNLFDREIDVTCDHEIYQAKDRERWSISRPRTRSRVGADRLKELDVQFTHKSKLATGNLPSTEAPASNIAGDTAK
jgi:hypothetical protein